jgi:hypothetical protein
MGQVSWTAATAGRYWIDMVVEQRQLRFMVDLGLVDSNNKVGMEVDPLLYDSLEKAGRFRAIETRNWRSASGQWHAVQTGLVEAQLFDPQSRLAVGPSIQVYVSRGFPGVANRVGVVFFHLLAGCNVAWDLGSRTWTVTYP